MRIYLETSAAAKLMIRELESAALEAFCEGDDELVATPLLETELLRITHRTGLDAKDAEAVLQSVALHDLPPAAYAQAGLLPDPHLRSLEALHIAGALRVAADIILTYDHRVTTAATSVGLRAFSPGRLAPDQA